MKRLLLLLLLCLGLISFAQTTWTGAGTNSNWNNTANWNTNLVPTALDDAIIPGGSSVIINVSSFVKSVVVQGTSTITMNQSLSFTNASSFSANTTVNWNSGSLYGGGTLTNNGSIIMNTASSRYISGATTLINNGTLTMPDGGYFYLYDTSILNNTASGTFDIQSNAYVQYSGSGHNFINAGLLKKSGGNGVSYFYAVLTNTGTISVENGTLDMYYLAKNFNGGVYNVSSGSTLLVSTTGMNISGTLTGTLDGALNWTGNLSVATTAKFNFTGDTGVTWSSGSLIGGGVLTNESSINMATAGSRYISGGTTLTNNGTMTMPNGGYFYLYDTSILNNATSGIFDLQSNAYVSYNGTDHNFINAGLLKKTGGGGVSYFYPNLTNTGTISVENGTLDMYYLGKNFNGGVYNVSTGNTLLISTTGMNISGTLTGNLDGALNWIGNLSVPTTATFNFTGTTGVTWSSGSLIGGGVLTNESSINMATAGSRYISGGTTLTNNGTMKMPNGGYFYLYDTSIFNNATSGVFDLQSNAYISYDGTDHNFINAGLLKKTGGNGTSLFYANLVNTGTISVENGTLDMYYLGKTFNGGVYNVSSGTTLLVSTTGMNISGTLTGNLDGALNWTGNLSVANAAIFNFTGITGVNWTSGYLLGGGTLTNKSKISLAGGGSRYISGKDTKLINTGTITLPNGGYLYLNNNATIDNQSSGVIDLKSNAYISYNGSEAFSINNAGLIQKTGGNLSYIYPPVTNSGTINASSSTLAFVDGKNFINTVDGIIKGTATIDLPADVNFTNAGTFAPGNSPGVLTVLGNYKSAASSTLNVELNGLTQSTEYDLLAITGTNVIFNGSVAITMGFDAAVGNQFTIATTSGTIATANLTSPIGNVDYNGFRYTFDVSYPSNKNVLLTITNKVDILPPTVITKNITVQLDGSGNANISAAQVNNGSTDNYSAPANLIYSLDKSTFTCANLGTNTVMLTVTDEAGNFASAPATVTVSDGISPIITCSPDLTVSSFGPYTVPNYFANNTVVTSDNCSVTTKTQTPSAGTSLAFGVHTISFNISDGSANTASCSFKLTVKDASLSTVDSELSNKNIFIYPNPVVDLLSIKNSSTEKLLDVEIFDASGKMVKKIDLTTMGEVKTISLKNLSTGVYLLKIKSLKGSVTKRIIKK